jgi:hypothetical protein
LDFKKALTIYDTLVVVGNLTMDKEPLVVQTGGLLIVFGNLTFGNKVDLANNSLIIVTGDVSFHASGHDDYTGSGQMFVDGSVSGNGDAESADESFSDLEEQYPIFYEFATGQSTTLPVEFVYVEAKQIGSSVTIAWATASELNNDYFTVEHSADGKQFTVIGTVKGAGDSQQTLTYSFTDPTPATGINFYRVKQTDFDGAFDFSEVVAARFSIQNGQPLTLSPNPATGVFKVDLTTYHEQQVFLEIVDFSGQTIATKKYDLSVNFNPWVEIDLSNQPKGMYYVMLKTATQVNKGKVIII